MHRYENISFSDNNAEDRQDAWHNLYLLHSLYIYCFSAMLLFFSFLNYTIDLYFVY